MNVSEKLHAGYFSEIYAHVFIGELILLAFEVALAAIFKTKQLQPPTDPQTNIWSEGNYRSKEELKPSEGDHQRFNKSFEGPTEEQRPHPVTTLSNMFLAHALVAAISLGTPLHAVHVLVLAWLHGASFTVALILTVHEKRWAYVFKLLCQLFNVVILCLCLVEKGLQIPIFKEIKQFSQH